MTKTYKTKNWIAYHKLLEQLIEKIVSNKEATGGSSTFNMGELKVTLTIDFEEISDD